MEEIRFDGHQVKQLVSIARRYIGYRYDIFLYIINNKALIAIFHDWPMYHSLIQAFSYFVCNIPFSFGLSLSMHCFLRTAHIISIGSVAIIFNICIYRNGCSLMLTFIIGNCSTVCTNFLSGFS